MPWGTEDINLHRYWEASWVTSCQRGTMKGEQTQAPSPTGQKCQVTFSKERGLAPEMTREVQGAEQKNASVMPNAGRLPVAHAIMAGGLAVDWYNTMGDCELSMTMGGGPNHPSWGWGHGPWVPTATWAPSSTTPGAERAYCDRHWCRRQPPSIITVNAIITATATPKDPEPSPCLQPNG